MKLSHDIVFLRFAEVQAGNIIHKTPPLTLFFCCCTLGILRRNIPALIQNFVLIINSDVKWCGRSNWLICIQATSVTYRRWSSGDNTLFTLMICGFVRLCCVYVHYYGCMCAPAHAGASSELRHPCVEHHSGPINICVLCMSWTPSDNDNHLHGFKHLIKSV